MMIVVFIYASNYYELSIGKSWLTKHKRNKLRIKYGVTYQKETLDGLVGVIVRVWPLEIEQHLHHGLLLHINIIHELPIIINDTLHKLVPLVVYRHQLLLHPSEPKPPHQRQEIHHIRLKRYLRRRRRYLLQHLRFPRILRTLAIISTKPDSSQNKSLPA